ncbi:MAG: alanine racemase [Bacteroidales bacterium]
MILIIFTKITDIFELIKTDPAARQEIAKKTNIARMSARLTNYDILFRPHFKTHQSRTVGGWFQGGWSRKIAVSSATMAGYFIADGWNDVTIAFPYNTREHQLLEDLAAKANITLTIPGVESAMNLAAKAKTYFGVNIKIDTGYNRSGTRWDDTETVMQILKILKSNKHIVVTGLLSHSGDTYKAADASGVKAIYNLSVSRMKELRSRIDHPGLIISLGDTPSASLVEEFGDVDELRPGNFVFYDLMQHLAGNCSFYDIAVAMACPVVDIRHKSGKMVIYGGAVHLSKESVKVGNDNIFGLLVKIENNKWIPASVRAYVTSLSQEHGIISAPDSLLREFSPGDLAGVIPVHSCLTAELAGGYMLTDRTYADHLCEKKNF